MIVYHFGALLSLMAYHSLRLYSDIIELMYDKIGDSARKPANFAKIVKILTFISGYVLSNLVG